MHEHGSARGAGAGVQRPAREWGGGGAARAALRARTMMPGCLGRPTMEGKTARGASSPAKPALHMPDPLSTTSACTSSLYRTHGRGEGRQVCVSGRLAQCACKGLGEGGGEGGAKQKEQQQAGSPASRSAHGQRTILGSLLFAVRRCSPAAKSHSSPATGRVVRAHTHISHLSQLEWCVF